MTDIVTTVDVFSAFDQSRHSEALENIQRAMQGGVDPRREAMVSILINAAPLELGYSKGPELARVSGAIPAL